jgi:hypothetical protein
MCHLGRLIFFFFFFFHITYKIHKRIFIRKGNSQQFTYFSIMNGADVAENKYQVHQVVKNLSSIEWHAFFSCVCFRPFGSFGSSLPLMYFH